MLAITLCVDINQLAKVYNVGFLLEDVKVRFKKDIKIDIFSISLEAKENDLQNVPRWLADILQENDIAEIQVQDMSVDLLRALSRERIAGADQLSTLKPDFYVRMNAYIKSKQGAEREKLNISMQDLVILRLGKIIHLARSAPMNPDLEQKLTYEEKTLFQLIHKASKDFRECVLGGKQ
jgi:DNA replication factor GINS